MSILYEMLKKECEAQGITGYRLCKDCGISPSTMTDLAKGRKKSCSADYINRFAKRLGVSVQYLLGEEETKKDPTENGIGEVSRSEIIDYAEKLSAEEQEQLLKMAKVMFGER